MQNLIMSSGGDSRNARSIPKHTDTLSTVKPVAHEVSPVPAYKAKRSISLCDLQPGEAAQYKERQTAEVVTVARFADRQMWEDPASTAAFNSVTKVTEKTKIRVTAEDCEVKPKYGTAFLFPALVLGMAYERYTEPEAA
jgi:hypothetical protein